MKNFIFALLVLLCTSCAFADGAGLPPPSTHSRNTHSITLTWDASATPNVTYNVYRSESPNACPTSPLVLGIEETRYVDTSIQAGMKYYYNVSSVNANGETCSVTEQECSTSLKQCKAHIETDTVTLNWFKP